MRHGQVVLRAVPARGHLRAFVLACCVALATILLPAQGALASPCPNEVIREDQGPAVAALPDCMALEMVSPPQKGGQAARPLEVSADGGRVLFASTAELAGTASILDSNGDPYVASRTESGWQTATTNPPAEELNKGWVDFPRAHSFLPDLSRWFQTAATSFQFERGVQQAFEAGLGGLFEPFSPLLTPVGATGRLDTVVSSTVFSGASAEHSRLYLWTEGTSTKPISFLPGDPAPAGTAAEGNTYVTGRDPSGQPTLALLARDNQNKVWGGACGTRIGGNSGNVSVGTVRSQGAISADGGRVLFSTRPNQAATGACDTVNKLRILKRLEASPAPWIGELFTPTCGSCKTEAELNGSDFYQGASVDGTKVYFTTNRQLAASDHDGTAAECSPSTAVGGCDLYLYDESLPPGQRLVQVSAAATEAKVLSGTVGISGDGSHVYYVAEGALTGANAEGKSPSAGAGARNLYLYERDATYPSGHTVFVGTLASADQNSLWGKQGTWGNDAYSVPVLGTNSEGEEVGGDGHILVFRTAASLVAADADGGHADIYRYDASSSFPALKCLSCRLGGPDAEPFDVQRTEKVSRDLGGTDYAEMGRWASEDGETVSFLTDESMLPGETGSAVRAYLWRDGQLVRLPGNARRFEPNLGSAVPTLSHDGSTVAYSTSTSLLPADGDTVADVYVARVDGGYASPSVEEDACQPDEGLPGRLCRGDGGRTPVSSGAGSEVAGTGNAKAAPRCRKGFVRRHGKCVKKPVHRHKKDHKKSKKAHGHSRHASNGRGAG